MTPGQAIVGGLIATLWLDLIIGAVLGGFLVLKALRTPEAVLQAQAGPRMTQMATERGMTMRAMCLRVLAPAAVVFWPLVVVLMLKEDQ